MGFADPVRPEDVRNADVFMSYVCQTVGSPWAMQDRVVMRKKVNEFFAAYPQCDYSALVRIAQWARSKKKRPPHAYYVVDYARYAWSDGAVPEMDPSNSYSKIDEGVRQALEVETDPYWREKLAMSTGDGRVEVFNAWKQTKYG